tara:strand:- start:333 stop:1319 length:987 start_codon:yes stop_codon:yes gene_type:complete
MRNNRLGNTELNISELGFGCGAVGGLMVLGEHKEMFDAIEYAIDSGVNYFDTARVYGDGLSEIHTGAILRELRRTDLIVGTKVRVSGSEFEDISNTVSDQIDNSLRRLGLDTIDIVYTHNRIGSERNVSSGTFSLEDLSPVVEVFEAAVKAGKIKYWGFNGLGETGAIKESLNRYSPSAIHTCYNLLNPTSGYDLPPSFSYQNFEQLMNVASDKGIGTVGIRILAGGALSGSVERHPIAQQNVDPISTSNTFQEDVNRTSDFQFLITEGFVENFVEASVRFAISNNNLDTSLIGLSNFDQLKQAIQYVNRGPLSQEAIDKISDTWTSK